MKQKDMDESKVCKHCKSEIPQDAKICPQCRKRVKGRKLKWIIIALVVIVVIVAVAGGGDSGTKKVGEVTQTDSKTEPAPQASTQPVESSTKEPPAEEVAVQSVYHVGDILQDGDMKIVYMSSGEYTEDNELLQPTEGHKYIYIQLAFENTAQSGDATVSLYNFDGYADGYAAEMYYGGEEGLSATLSAGRSTTGFLYFSVPVDAQDIEIEYKPNAFAAEKITFSYDGEQDSGYVPEQNTAASADAYHVGDVIESDKMIITYISCEEYVSDNQFIQPAEGNHFITCTFEFENVSDSDELISYFDFGHC